MNIIKNIIRKFRVKTIMKPIIVMKEPSNLLEGKVALVTGGSSGIGYAIAKVMVEAGAYVYIVGRNKEKLSKVAEQIGSSYITIDITKINEVESFFDIFLRDKNIDILVNAAGTHGSDLFGSVTEKNWDDVMSINLKALYFISQIIANQMIKKNIKGHILNVSSASSKKPSWTPYEISKRAVNGITEGMAHKLIEHGIVVNGIAPGPTATPMMASLMEDGGIQWPGNPSKRMQTVEEIASLALFLVSNQGDSVVGDTFFITGGSGTVCIDK